MGARIGVRGKHSGVLAIAGLGHYPGLTDAGPGMGFPRILHGPGPLDSARSELGRVACVCSRRRMPRMHICTVQTAVRALLTHSQDPIHLGMHACMYVRMSVCMYVQRAAQPGRRKSTGCSMGSCGAWTSGIRRPVWYTCRPTPVNYTYF